ncbi:NEAT domain-containing protein [Levilactobacillus parabrevis]|uniref:NEAT domain-containing protein n=1 Tax=Levilactobacillus parabrevis TaxID=357278 RepID=UPI00036BD004|nr:NEAT domain-containing protein [Levilactobacillus parabrevis]
MRRIRQLVLTIAAVLGGLALLTPLAVHAQTIDYSALKYGTKENSMASGYFVHPATIAVKNHAYVVTMDLKTAKKLTSWPVRVLSVDGHAPENVRKVKDGAGNSHVYYSFTTTNLKRNINAKLAINVPDVYKAKHNITFRFKTNSLPALGSKATTQTTRTQRTTQGKAASASSVKPAATTASQEAASSSQASSKAKAKSAAAATSSTSSQPASQSSKTSRDSQQASASDQVPQQKTHWGGLIGGVAAIVLLVGGGSWWYFGKH